MAERQLIIPRWLTTSINIGVAAYVVLRAVAVWGELGKYGVDPFVFLVLDVVTIVPYTWGLTQLWGYMRGITSVKWMFVGAVSAIIGFTLPYIYVYLAGGSMPLSTKLIVLAIILFIVIVGPYREWRKRRKE